MIVSICGFGYSGSGALKDYLSEFKDVNVLRNIEFQLLYFPDGISDLDFHLNCSCNRHYDCDLAIKRFGTLCRKWDAEYPSIFNGKLYQLALDYTNSLVQVEGLGSWTYDRLGFPPEYYDGINEKNRKILKRNKILHFCNRCLRKLHLPQFKEKAETPYFADRPFYISIKPERFMQKTHEFMDNVLDLVGANTGKFVVFDQFTPPGNPALYNKYVPRDIKTIVVSRDPRDLYLFSRLKNPSFIPHRNVEEFVDWYRYTQSPELLVDDESVLRLRFEDLIYEYDKTSNLLKSFLGLEGESDKKKFNPSVSVVNTKIFERYPEYKEDVKFISENLKDYLYDYSKHENVAPEKGVSIF